jgi:hypothetical protein
VQEQFKMEEKNEERVVKYGTRGVIKAKEGEKINFMKIALSSEETI